VSADNIMVTAIKEAADKDGLVLRAYESVGRKTVTEITLFGKRIRTEFAPNQVKTFKVKADGEVSEINFIEE